MQTKFEEIFFEIDLKKISKLNKHHLLWEKFVNTLLFIFYTILLWKIKEM